MFIRSVFVSSSLVAGLLMGSAAHADTSEIIKPGPEARLLGDYLAGSYARYIGDPRAQSQYFQDAFSLAPEDTRIGRLALYSALFSGDHDLAKKMAEKLYKQDRDESMARAVLAVEAMSRGRTSRVKKYATKPTNDVTMGIAMKLMLGWTAVDEGRTQRARDIFKNLGGSGYFTALGNLQIAKLEARLGNETAAIAAFDRVEQSGIARLEYNLSRARFDAARGETALARTRLEAMISDNQAAEIGPIGDYLDRVIAGDDLPKLSIRDEAARALTEPAFAFFVRNKSTEGAEVFLRFARWVEPDFDRSALWLADLIEETHPEPDEATRAELFALYRGVEPDDPYYVNAQLGEANLYFDQDKDDVATEMLERLAESHPSYYTREALGRVRFFRENWEGALPFYDTLVESLSEEELAVNPTPLRLRGIIFERLGRWDEAEADFQRVLSYKPDDADTLNYLGYTWVDRGENLEEAFELIEKAVELEPNSGAITDSLGWAHYKLGRYEEAKTYLERAVVLTPYSATIIDHLGDVYWRLGRKREAAYQWKRALEYDPTDEERETIKLKIDSGINATPAP